jgi:hypothetical protein
MLSAPVSIEPKPEVIDPVPRAPVPVIAVLTASLVSTNAASLPSNLLNSVASTVMPFKTKTELLLPVAVSVPVALPIVVANVPVELIKVVPSTVTAPLIPTVSVESPTVMVSASALVPTLMVSQAAELQIDTEVAVVLPMARAPALAVSTPGVRTDVSAYRVLKLKLLLPRSIVLSALGRSAVLIATLLRLDSAVLAQVGQVPAPPATPATTRQTVLAES